MAAAESMRAEASPQTLSTHVPRMIPALGRLAALEALAQQELAGIARLQVADAPTQDDLLSILVAWDLAL